jgi:quercetin dioxygenase-like cupin family protein
MKRMIEVALAATIVMVGIGGATRAQEGKHLQPVVSALAKSTKTVIGQPLVFPQSSAEITAVLVTLPAGGPPGRVHKHPHQRIAYVLEGTLGVEQEGGETRHYPAGSILIEMRDEWHRAGVVGATPVKLLIIDITPQGEPNMIWK